jgi:hypothetical protein
LITFIYWENNKKWESGCFFQEHIKPLVKTSSPTEENTMVAFVKITKKGTLVRIKEVPDKYRDQAYVWDEDEK